MRLRIDGERLREMRAPLVGRRKTLVVTTMRLSFDEARRSLHGRTLFMMNEPLLVNDERRVVNAKPLLLDERTLPRKSEPLFHDNGPLLRDHETLLPMNGRRVAMKKTTHGRSPTLSSSNATLSSSKTTLSRGSTRSLEAAHDGAPIGTARSYLRATFHEARSP
jgi:hypothetical protein